MVIFLKIARVINSIVYKFFKKRFLISNIYHKTGTALRINQLLNFTMGVSYLEIGVNYGFTFEGVKAKKKIGVDPNKNFYTLKPKSFKQDTSNNFFRLNTKKFDLIFIDGLHEYKQVLKDIINSLNILNKNGMLLIDDVYPINFAMAAKSWELLDEQEKQGVSRGAFSWQGDVYRAIFLLNYEYKQFINCYTITDNNHIQMVMWKKNDEFKINFPSENMLSKYSGVGLIDELKNGIPRSWNPCSMATLCTNLQNNLLK
jgi:hypothetical protein